MAWWGWPDGLLGPRTQSGCSRSSGHTPPRRRRRTKRRPTTTAYNDGNFVLLGLVIEKVTGQTVQDHLTGLIGELGLTSTSYPTGNALPEPYVHGYYSDGKTSPPASGYRDTTVQTPVIPFSAGAIISTVPDMTRYAVELGTGAGLTPETWQQRQTWTPFTTTGVRLQYGLGITQIGEWIVTTGRSSAIATWFSTCRPRRRLWSSWATPPIRSRCRRTSCGATWSSCLPEHTDDVAMIPTRRGRSLVPANSKCP